jgi:hypothetical protein
VNQLNEKRDWRVKKMKLTWSGLSCPCKIKVGNTAILAEWKYNIGVVPPANRRVLWYGGNKCLFIRNIDTSQCKSAVADEFVN